VRSEPAYESTDSIHVSVVPAPPGSAQFELCISQGVIPKSPRFYQRAEGSPVAHSVVAGDPWLRLKNGYPQDDAIDEREIQNEPLPAARMD